MISSQSWWTLCNLVCVLHVLLKSPSKCFDFPPLCSTKSQKWFITPKACQRRNQSQPKLASGWGWWSCCVLRSKLNPMLWWVAGGVHFRSFSPVCFCYPNPFIRVGIFFFIPSTPPGSTWWSKSPSAIAVGLFCCTKLKLAWRWVRHESQKWA